MQNERTALQCKSQFLEKNIKINYTARYAFLKDKPETSHKQNNCR